MKKMKKIVGIFTSIIILFGGYFLFNNAHKSKPKSIKTWTRKSFYVESQFQLSLAHTS